MDNDYAGSTIQQTYICMGTMLKSALMNDLIVRHPMNGVRYTKPVRAVNDIKYLTLEEQEKFMEVAKRSHNYYQYALLLETGLRTGELVGLTWDAIDWKKRTLTVQAMRRGKNQAVLYACPTSYIRNRGNRKRHATQSVAEAAWTRRHQNNNGSLCSRDRGFTAQSNQTV